LELLGSLRPILGILVDESGVRAFLDRPDPAKDQLTRFIAWLFTFGLVPLNSEGIFAAFCEFRDDYERLKALHLTDGVPSTTPALNRLVRGDVERTVTWFVKLAPQLGIPERLYPQAEAITHRVLIFIGNSSPRYTYVQGYDRFVFLSYLVTLNFFANCGEHVEFVEPLTFQLTKRFLALGDIIDLLGNFQELHRHFGQLDADIRIMYPALWERLVRIGYSTLHFALRWEILMFADEHSVTDLFLLWDKLVAHRNHYPQYMRAMCLAHLGQVPADEGVSSIQTFQTFQNWDTVALLNEVDRLVDDGSWTTGQTIAIGVSLLLVAGALFWVVRRRSRK
jgi:hypothetical protein